MIFSNDKNELLKAPVLTGAFLRSCKVVIKVMIPDAPLLLELPGSLLSVTM